MSDGIYYDWNKTMTYDAQINMVISMRGYGKTYGLRKQCIKDFLKDGSKFMEVVRYKELLKGESAIQYGYFDKLILNDEFPDYIFRVNGTNGYIAKKPADENEKPKWFHLCYFVALSAMQQAKQRTFVNVKRVIFDEFIIDKRTGHRYLSGEFNLFANLIDSIAREEVDKDGNAKGTKVHAYLLGNACDLTNPYFVRWGINQQPKEGYSWFAGKLVLLHYAKDASYQAGKRDTLVGRLVAGTAEESIIVDNEFKIGDEYNIAKKSAGALFQYGIICNGMSFGVWMDISKGFIYINNKVPDGSGKPVMALTREDNTANYIQVRRGEKTLKMLMDMYYADCLRFSNVGIRDRFLDSMAMFGIR
jgi:hypothetical protein